MMTGQKTPETSGFTFEVARRDITNSDESLAWLVEQMKAMGGAGAEGRPEGSKKKDDTKPMKRD